jgi:hypothetical protein
MDDQRDMTQRRVFKPAKIAFGRAGIIDCTVRTISDAGACLQVGSPLGIPETFNLLLDAGQTTRPCHIVWRKEQQIGVEFR